MHLGYSIVLHLGIDAPTKINYRIKFELDLFNHESFNIIFKYITNHMKS
jgi:hypothetical protein